MSAQPQGMRRAVYWSYAGQIASSVLTFVGSVVVTRLLSPGEFGIFAMAMAAQGTLGVLTAFSVNSWIVSHADLKPGHLDSAFTVNAAIMAMLSAMLVVISFFSRPLLGDVGAGQVMRVLALAPLIAIGSFRPMAMMQRDLEFRKVSMINVATGAVSLSTTIVSALLGASYMSAAYGSVAGAVTTLLATSAWAPRHVAWRWSLAESRQIMRFGLNMVSVSGVSALGARLSELSLGRLLGFATLGLYSRANSIHLLLFDNVYGTATRVSFSQLSLDARTSGDIRPTFLRSLSLILAIMWPMQLGLAVLAAPVINVVYGPAWEAAAVQLTILLIGQALAMTFGMNWELFVIRGELRTQTRYEMLRAIGGLVVFVLGCFVSLTAASLGRLTDVLIGVVVYRRHVDRLARLGRGELNATCRKAALVSAGAIAPPFALRVASGWSTHLPVLWMVASVALGGVLWLWIAARLRHPLHEEVAKIADVARRAVLRRSRA